jgi:hypothetical protein
MSDSFVWILSLLWRRVWGISGVVVVVVVVDDDDDIEDGFADSRGTLSQRLFPRDGNDSRRCLDFLDGK